MNNFTFIFGLLLLFLPIFSLPISLLYQLSSLGWAHFYIDLRQSIHLVYLFVGDELTTYPTFIVSIALLSI
jgi:hypothetical protein